MPPDLIRGTQLCVLFCKRYIPQQAWAHFQRKLITAVEQKGEAKCFNAGNIPTLLLCCLVTRPGPVGTGPQPVLRHFQNVGHCNGAPALLSASCAWQQHRQSPLVSLLETLEDPP